jgi:hypothetical protein
MNNILHSEKIDLIAQSLHKFQNELENIKRDTQAYNYKYATLGSCLDHVRPLLFKYDLAVTQVADFDHHGNQFLITYLLHTSGQYMTSRLLYAQGVENNNTKSSKDVEMKALGLCISYLRRYGLSGILGLAQEDDEDKLDVKSPVKNNSQFKDFPPKPMMPIAKSVPAKITGSPTLNVLETQNKNKIKSLCEKNGIEVADFANHFKLSTKTALDLMTYIENFEDYKQEYLTSVFK